MTFLCSVKNALLFVLCRHWILCGISANIGHFCWFYADLAIGAPYEGNGAVYIFSGGHDGLKSEPSQRIYAGQLPSLVQPLRTFGHTLSAGVDMDLNGYPDMVVGAFGVDKLLMFRARPVINVISTMRSTPSRIAPQVSPSNQCEDRPDTSCVELELCFRFTTKPRDRSVLLYAGTGIK